MPHADKNGVKKVREWLMSKANCLNGLFLRVLSQDGVFTDSYSC